MLVRSCSNRPLPGAVGDLCYDLWISLGEGTTRCLLLFAIPSRPLVVQSLTGAQIGLSQVSTPRGPLASNAAAGDSLPRTYRLAGTIIGGVLGIVGGLQVQNEACEGLCNSFSDRIWFLIPTLVLSVIGGWIGSTLNKEQEATMTSPADMSAATILLLLSIVSAEGVRAQAATGPRLGPSNSAQAPARLDRSLLLLNREVAPSHWQRGAIIGGLIAGALGYLIYYRAVTDQGNRGRKMFELTFGGALIGGLIGSGSHKK
jgi:hypothetical protein